MLEVVGISIPIFWLWSVLNFLLIYLLDITETEICARILSSATNLYSVGSAKHFTLSTHIHIERIGIDQNRLCVVVSTGLSVHNHRIDKLISPRKVRSISLINHWLPGKRSHWGFLFSTDGTQSYTGYHMVFKDRPVLPGNFYHEGITNTRSDPRLDNSSMSNSTISSHLQTLRAVWSIYPNLWYGMVSCITGHGRRNRCSTILNCRRSNYGLDFLFLAGAQESYNREHHHEQSKDWNSEFFHLFNFLFMGLIPWMERYQLCVVVR